MPAPNEDPTAGRARSEGPMEDAVPVPITDVLDLHSFHPRDVKVVVEEYLTATRDKGYRYLRIIHGRGSGVQRQIVRAVLARTPWVEDFRDAPPEAGGWGATLVTLDPPSRA